MLCASIGWFAVDENRDLQLQDMAVLAKSKLHQLHAAHVARFPLGSFQRLIGFIGGRPFHVFAALLHRLRIDFVGLLFSHVDEQIALPKVYEQKSLFLRVINVPGLRRFVIELYDGKSHGFPEQFLFAGLRLSTYEGSARRGDEESGRERAKQSKGFHSKKLASSHMTTMANEIKQAGHLSFPLPGRAKTIPMRPKSSPTL